MAVEMNNPYYISISHLKEIAGVNTSAPALLPNLYHVVGNYFNCIGMDARLGSCIKSISTIYSSCLGDTSKRPDWSDISYRRAYMYRFFMMHSYMVYRGLQKSLADHKYIAASWIDRLYLRACCIGGGPGSDVVGLTRFLQANKLFPIPFLKCTIFDIYPEWKEEWEIVENSNKGQFPMNVTYLPSNMTLKDGCLCTLGLAAVQSADIITMIKSFSTIAAFIRKDAAHGNLLREMFREMKPGALVLYIDNRSDDQREALRRIAQSGGVRDCLYEWHGELKLTKTMLATQPVSVNVISQTIGLDPMKSCKVSIMLLRKPTEFRHQIGRSLRN